MTVVGVDLGGRKAAVAVLSGQELQTHTIEVDPAFPRHQQLAQVGAFVADLCGDSYQPVVYVEEALIGRGVRSSLMIAQCQGAVYGALALAAVTSVYAVPVDAWKKGVCGKGGISKEQVSEWLDKVHPCYSAHCDGDQDRIDAACIAIYGQQQQLIAASLREDFDYLGA